MKITLSKEQQEKVIRHITTTHQEYETLMNTYLAEKAEEYDEYTTFELKKQNAWNTNVKVNKAFEAVEKRAGKLTSKEPNWITSVRPDIEYTIYQKEGEELQTEVEKIRKTGQVTESILKDTWKRGDVVEASDRMAKDFASLWVAIGKATYKYKTKFDEENTTDIEIDEFGEEIATKKNENIGRVKKIPTIDNVSVDRVFYDINYKDFDDLPCVIELVTWVRASHILNDNRYMNNKELAEIIMSQSGNNKEELRDSIKRISWVTVENPTTIDEKSLILKEYYWYFNLTDDPRKEKLYHFCIVNNSLVIYAKEIKTIPFCMVRLFEDTLSLRAVGIVRPVIGIQKDFNFKRAARSQAIKQSINKKYIMWPAAWISPRDLAKPDGIVMTDKDMVTFQNNFMELRQNDISPNLFNDNADDQREMQAMMFSQDTTQPSAPWSTIDTATWSKIEFYENNIVINKARIKYERFLSKLWEKILYAMVDNMSEIDNYYTKVDDELVAIHKVQIQKALDDMSINIEMWSTNYEKEKQRRDELFVVYNWLLKAKQMWSNVKVDKALKEWIETFNIKDVDSYFMPDMAMLWLSQENQTSSWQPTSKSLLKDMDTSTWSQTMDFTNSIAWTSIDLPV